MIRSISKILTLTTPLRYYTAQPRRNPLIPTQANILKPFNISNLHDNIGSTRNSKILGRGPASGKGKTCGRGHKGHKARAGGGVHVRFEGGQTPLQQRLPKYGKKKLFRPPFDQVNMHQIDYFVKRGIINPAQKITIKVLSDVGIVKKVKTGVKLLGKGIQYINYPLNLQVSDASKTVINKIKQFGGCIQLVHRTPLKLREHMYPQKFPLPLAQPITSAYMVRKLQRKQKDRGLNIIYKKPKWKVEQEKAGIKQKSSFIYPVPRVPNPTKIRKRRPQLFRKISLV